MRTATSSSATVGSNRRPPVAASPAAALHVAEDPVRPAVDRDRRLRIVHVVRQFHPAIGGLESVVLELATAQARRGHRVRVVTLDRVARDNLALPQRDAVDGVDIVRLRFFGSNRYPIAPSAIRHIGDADLVHVHAIDFFVDYLGWTKPLHRRKLVVSTHGGFFHTTYAARLKRWYFSTVTRATLAWYDGVVAVGASDLESFRRIRPSGMVCIENGVNIARFADAGSRTPAKSIVSIGRFATNKRLDLLMRFVAALRRRDPEWTLRIAGRPWDFDADALTAIAEREGVRDFVEIVASPSEEGIRDLMGSCSVIASASEYEGFGLTAIEGMSAGLLPLLSDIPPFHRVIDRAGIGLIVDFADAESASARFERQWPEFEASYAAHRKSLMRVAAEYGWPRVSEQYQDLYDAALGTTTRAILGVPIRVAKFSEAVDLLDRRFRNGERAVVAFANAHTLNVSATDARFAAALRQAIVFNDGIGVDIASFLLFGAAFPENLNGTDFVPAYLASTANRYRIFLLGGRPGVAERAAERLSQRYPRHAVVGCRHGYFSSRDAAGVVDAIRASRADVVLVAMGNPHQELWLTEHLEATGCRLGFGVGALFDFLAAEVPRAPQWMQSARLEWVFRLAQEPRRLLRRYLIGNVTFLVRVIGQWASGGRV